VDDKVEPLGGDVRATPTNQNLTDRLNTNNRRDHQSQKSKDELENHDHYSLKERIKFGRGRGKRGYASVFGLFVWRCSVSRMSEIDRWVRSKGNKNHLEVSLWREFVLVTSLDVNKKN